MFRRPKLIRRRGELFEITIDERSREVLALLLTDLAEQIENEPDHPNLERLRPPAYSDDPDKDAAYQLLAGEELRTARGQAIRTVIETLPAEELTEDQLWAWLQALNAVRLVVGTALGIDDDEADRPELEALADEEQVMWSIYDFSTYLQYEAITALGG